ncbi:unnamed protein product [Oppiella nova]|uniref:Rhamnogalacturonase A/B/Epimerase-like pectate lyase domain-containing protein n=1 Tax=Oppiella nova TaxID=334625 RepID=A0A7R9MBH1_9ACAR|nr:unnamed protein product [Oppiella nova]CAG2174233.1 unnamed protein product [Oppiella nova]
MFMPYILLAASVACVWTASADTFDVTKYGADPKGVKKSTDAVHKAIEAAVSAGGGVVHFPAGHYLCGPIELRSHVTLDVADGAVVKFSDDLDDYQPVVEAMADGSRQTSFATKGLISASKLTNIGITGAGVLDGQGSAWWKLVDSPYRAEYLRSMNRTQSANTDTIANRPKFFIATDCKNIVLKDITFKDSPFFHVNVVDCDGVTIEGIKLDSPADSPNTDGIDPDSSKNILISKVTINAGDDCIAIKAGMDDSKERAPTENLIIRDSHMGHGHGGVSIGSDFVGGVRNVTVMDCVFDGPDRGFYIKSARGRGG